MKKQIEMLREFHNAYNDPFQSKPTLDVSEVKKQFRVGLLREEVEEIADALKENDIYKLADGLGDVLYALLGAVGVFGLQDKFEEIFVEIHRSNMSKLGEDGKPIISPEGKAIKSPNYTKPDIKKILDN